MTSHQYDAGTPLRSTNQRRRRPDSGGLRDLAMDSARFLGFPGPGGVLCVSFAIGPLGLYTDQ